MDQDAKEQRRLRMVELGRKGGKATYRKHGSAHMSTIGKAGFKALATFAKGGRMTALRKLAAKGRIVPFHGKPDLNETETAELYKSVGLD